MLLNRQNIDHLQIQAAEKDFNIRFQIKVELPQFLRTQNGLDHLKMYAHRSNIPPVLLTHNEITSKLEESKDSLF